MKIPWWNVASRGLRRIVLRACGIDETHVRTLWEDLPEDVRKEIGEATERVKAFRTASWEEEQRKERFAKASFH